MQIERITSRGQLVPLLFMDDAVAASQTDAQMPIIGTGATTGLTSVDGYIMPFAGEIVAISWLLSAAGSAGTAAVGATIGGTERSGTTQSLGTAASGRAVFGRGSHAFAAGANIGCEITTDGSWNGTSSDLAVIVWVLLSVEGI